MPTVTNGTITYTRRLNTGDYSHKDAQVSLTFTVEPGEDAERMADYVRQIAVAQAHMITGEQAANVVPLPTVTDTKRTRGKKDAPAPLAVVGNAPSTADAMGDAPAATNSGGTATGPVLNAVGKAVDPLAGAASVVVVQGGNDPMGAAPVVTIQAQTQPANAAMGGTPATATAIVPAGVGTPALADTDLTTSVMKSMQTLAPVYGNEVAAAKCGDLILEFGGPGGVSAIPVDKRPDFMARLKTLA